MRIARAERGMDGKSLLTDPWRCLNELLSTAERLRWRGDEDQLGECEAIQWTDAAASVMELLLIAYVQVTLIAVNCVAKMKPDATPKQTRELLLRFHRNNLCEDIVCQQFKHLLRNTAEIVVTCVDKRVITCKFAARHFCAKLQEGIKCAIKAHRHLLFEAGQLEEVLLVWDEAAALIQLWPRLIITQAPTKQAEEEGDGAPTSPLERDGIYIGVRVAQWWLGRPFLMLFTGTTARMEVFDRDLADTSIRRGFRYFTPCTLVDRGQMQSHLSSYFN
jgi:hypothetical protein